MTRRSSVFSRALGGARRALSVFGQRRTTPQAVRGESWLQLGNVALRADLRDPEQALKIASVWRCVSLVSESVAMLPWHVLTRDGARKGPGQPAPYDDGVQWLLHNRPNPEQGAFDFRRLLLMRTMLWGNGYAEIERDARRRPTALWPIESGRCEPRRTADGALVYVVSQADGGVVTLPAADVFHTRGLSWDGVRGYSVLEYAGRSLGTAGRLDEFTERYFGQGARPSGVIKTNGQLDSVGAANLLAEFQKRAQGLSNFWAPIVLDAGMEWQALSGSLDDAQMIDMRKFSVLDVCRWFGVPPHLAFDLDRATFSNIESQGREFLMYGLLPRIVPLEQEADAKLLNDQHSGRYTKINVNAFQRGDSPARAAFYRSMREMGVLSVNEIRALEDLPGIGPDGDAYTPSVQYQTRETTSEPPAEPIVEPASSPRRARAGAHLNGSAH